MGAGQEDARRSILAFCDEHDDALVRTCLEGHLTGSAVVVDPSREATLLIHHRKLDLWLQPGGHADGEGDLGQVALREAEEETGLSDLALVTPAIDLDIHEIPARGDEPAHVHLDVRFLVLAPPGAQAAPDAEETLGAEWVTAADPDGRMASAELRRLVGRALRIASVVG